MLIYKPWSLSPWSVDTGGAAVSLAVAQSVFTLVWREGDTKAVLLFGVVLLNGGFVINTAVELNTFHIFGSKKNDQKCYEKETQKWLQPLMKHYPIKTGS